jgi:type I restriction enzyme S subunit
MSTVEGWENKKLIDLAYFINGYAFKPDDWSKEGLPIIRIEQLKNATSISDYYAGKLPERNIINNDDLIFSWSASLFLKIWKHGKAALNQHLFKVTEKDGFNRLFIKYLIEFYLPEFAKSAHGSTMQHITRKELERFNVLVPLSIQEQTKIAEILSCIDTAIEQTEAMIAKQQRIKTGLMQDLLSKGIDEHGNIRTEQTHAFKDSELGRIPVEWEVVRLENVTSHIVDCPHTTPFFVDDGVLVARTFNIKDGSFADANVFYVSETEFKERNARLEPQAGDIIFTREAPVGEAFLIPDGMRICLGQRTMLIRCNTQNCIPNYLIETLYSQNMRIRFDQMVGGTTNPHLNVADVRKLLVVLPKIQEQQKISNMLAKNRSFLRDLQSNKYKLDRQKTALMQDLLSGNVRVNHLLNTQEIA